jgi:hypothetical protein
MCVEMELIMVEGQEGLTNVRNQYKIIKLAKGRNEEKQKQLRKWIQ